MPQESELIRDGKYHVEMVAAQNPDLLFGKPLLNPQIGALGAHPVLTGIIPYSMKMAVRTGLSVASQHRSPADHKAVGRFSDEVGQSVSLFIGGISDQKYRKNGMLSRFFVSSQ
jgi:hypothetical protein